MRIFFILLILLPLAYSEVSGNFSFHCAGCLFGETYSTTTTTSSTTSTTTTTQSSTTTSSTSTTSSTTTTLETTTSLPSGGSSSIDVKLNLSEDSLRELLNNTELIKTLEGIIGKINMDKLIDTTLEESKNVKIEKTIIVTTNLTSIMLTVDYEGKHLLNNFMVYEIIPKEFAANASLLMISSHFNYSIVEEDPSILFYLKEFGTVKKSIIYKVNKTLDESIINQTKTIILIGSVTKREIGLGYIVGIIIVIAVGVVLFIFRERIIEYFEIKSYVRRGLRKKTLNFTEIIRKLEEKIKKREKKFVYKFRRKK